MIGLKVTIPSLKVKPDWRVCSRGPPESKITSAIISEIGDPSAISVIVALICIVSPAITIKEEGVDSTIISVCIPASTESASETL